MSHRSSRIHKSSFLKEYVRNFREIGSIVPDSRYCIKALLKNIPFDSAGVIVEFGGASGKMTKKILKLKRDETIFLCFEKNQNFFETNIKPLKGKNFIPLNNDVFEIAKILPSLGIESVDCIVSTLPCSQINCNEFIRKSVLSVLSDDGIFIQYVHTIAIFKGFMLSPILKRYFTSVKRDVVIRNIPPVYVYTCRGVKR